MDFLQPEHEYFFILRPYINNSVVTISFVVLKPYIEAHNAVLLFKYFSKKMLLLAKQ